jgi:hypothetical protein
MFFDTSLNSMMMYRSVLILLMGLLSGAVMAQKQGIGLRVGNPIGITYKRHLEKGRAVEFGLGTASSGWNKNYYKNSFKDLNRYDNFDYRSHATSSTVYFQGRYLFQYNIPIEGMVGKLDWYWGVGALLKFASLDYAYQDKKPPYTIISDRRTDLDFGPEGIAGMEYTFDNIPLEIFGDVSLMLEFADRPLTFRAFAGVGARFLF